MYRKRFMILVLRCFISLLDQLVAQPDDPARDCLKLIEDLKQHGGE